MDQEPFIFASHLILLLFNPVILITSKHLTNWTMFRNYIGSEKHKTVKSFIKQNQAGI